MWSRGAGKDFHSPRAWMSTPCGPEEGDGENTSARMMHLPDILSTLRTCCLFRTCYHTFPRSPSCSTGSRAAARASRQGLLSLGASAVHTPWDHSCLSPYPYPTSCYCVGSTARGGWASLLSFCSAPNSLPQRHVPFVLSPLRLCLPPLPPTPPSLTPLTPTWQK